MTPKDTPPSPASSAGSFQSVQNPKRFPRRMTLKPMGKIGRLKSMATTLPSISTIQYNSFPDLDDSRFLDESDLACLAKMQEVLEQHGKSHRFSIALIHRHFQLEENEILLETCDPERRILKCKPVNRSVLANPGVVPTSWVKDLGVTMGCEKVCLEDDSGRHYGYKDHLEDGEDDDD